MPKSISITADVSSATKSVLDLGRELGKLGKKSSPVSIFDVREQKFIKEELNTALKEMNRQFGTNIEYVDELLIQQSKVKKGTNEELSIRKKITNAMKIQAELAKKISDAKSTLGGGDAGGGFKMPGGLMKILTATIGAVVGRAAVLAFKANSTFVASTADRVRAQGLGMTEDDQNQGTPGELARAGMTRSSLIQSRIQATALGSREAGGHDATMQRGGFERTFGLERGQMTDVMSQLRPSVGGDAANQTQLKLQASILAAGIEDAVGPYLENMVGLLATINETGMTSTGQLISAFAMLSADGVRTPEQLAASFGGMNDAVKGSSGEQNAMLQMAFANQGIGGGTIGGTQLALSGGGIMGLDSAEFEDRGFSDDMMSTMGSMNLFGGMAEGGGLAARSEGIMNLAREMGGMGEDQSFGDISDPQQLVTMANLSNNLLGTTGMQGLSNMKLMEDLGQGVGGGEDGTRRMTREEFEKRQQDIMDSETTPDSKRLDKINDSLSGVTLILRDTQQSLLDVLGQQLVKVSNQIVGAENIGIGMGEEVASAAFEGGGGDGGGRSRNTGGVEFGNLGLSLSETILDPESMFDPEAPQSGKRNRNNQGKGDNLADAVELGNMRAYARRKRSDTRKNSDVNVTVRNTMPDGSIQDGTLGQ